MLIIFSSDANVYFPRAANYYVGTVLCLMLISYVILLSARIRVYITEIYLTQTRHNLCLLCGSLSFYKS